MLGIQLYSENQDTLVYKLGQVEAQKAMNGYNLPIDEMNTDQGTQFYDSGHAGRHNSKGDELGRFEEYLQDEDIRYVPTQTKKITRPNM